MSLGQRITYAFSEFLVDNSFYIVVLVTLVLFFLDFYHRFVRINKATDEINLVERYCWLQYYRKRSKGGLNVKR